MTDTLRLILKTDKSGYESSLFLLDVNTQAVEFVSAFSLINPEREAEFTDSVQLDEIMTRQVASVDPHAGIKEAALYLQRHKYGCLPVVRGRKLVGIVTESDFITVAINLLELMEEQEPPTDF